MMIEKDQLLSSKPAAKGLAALPQAEGGRGLRSPPPDNGAAPQTGARSLFVGCRQSELCVPAESCSVNRLLWKSPNFRFSTG
jgi:hypothetical protein